MGFLGGILGKREYTEEKRMVDAIKSTDRSRRAGRSGEYVKSILGAIPDIVFIVDSENKVTVSNDAARKLLGGDGVEGTLLSSITDVDLEKALHGSVEGRIKSKSGEVPAVFFGKDTIDLDGNPCIVLVAKVGPCTKEGCEEFRKTGKKRDEFVYMVAHELKTPAAAIRGFSELLKNENVFSNRETREKYLETTIREAERLDRIVSQILCLSGMDVGAMKPVIGRVDLSEIMKIADDNIRQQAEAKGISLEFHAGNITIESDKELLMQIILNLVDNAVKYTVSGSVKVSAKLDGVGLLLSVSDTGIGIPEESFGKIFTRFYEVDPSLSRKDGGTGLGLSVVKEIVEVLNGKIWFESKYGEGTTFYLRLPAKYTAAEEKTTGM